MKRILLGGMLAVVAVTGRAQVAVHATPESTDKAFNFSDPRFQVKFEVPPGWEFTTQDGEVSRFHADVEKAPRELVLRGVASMNFNPYPSSTLGGAMFYFSVGPKIPEDACLKLPTPEGAKPEAGKKGSRVEKQNIGGMKFVHSYDEAGDMCTEVRDEVYVAYRKGSCYRFDLKINTFCAVSSGAAEITDEELLDIERRMTGILSTVVLGWEKSGPQFVPAPPLPPVMPTIPVTPGKSAAVGQGVGF